MLDFLGETELSTRLMSAIESVLREQKVRTRDLGGANTTTEITEAICSALRVERLSLAETGRASN
jgi:tartrate dehydrogenase/decarboxylase/D-malate dehydrogenase